MIWAGSYMKDNKHQETSCVQTHLRVWYFRSILNYSLHNDMILNMLKIVLYPLNHLRNYPDDYWELKLKLFSCLLIWNQLCCIILYIQACNSNVFLNSIMSSNFSIPWLRGIFTLQCSFSAAEMTINRTTRLEVLYRIANS